MLTDEERFARLSGIGGSEIGIILGNDEGYWDGKRIVTKDWRDVLAVKTGQASDDEGNQYSDWGHRMEPLVAQWYLDTYGGAASKSKAIWSSKIPFAFCTPDRIIVRDNAKHGLECKNKAYSQKPKWKQGPPEAILDQVRWSMMVTEWDRWDVAALFNGNDPKCWTVHRDLAWEAEILPQAREFWAKVEKANQKLWG